MSRLIVARYQAKLTVKSKQVAVAATRQQQQVNSYIQLHTLPDSLSFSALLSKYHSFRLLLNSHRQLDSKLTSKQTRSLFPPSIDLKLSLSLAMTVVSIAWKVLVVSVAQSTLQSLLTYGLLEPLECVGATKLKLTGTLSCNRAYKHREREVSDLK